MPSPSEDLAGDVVRRAAERRESLLSRRRRRPFCRILAERGYDPVMDPGRARKLLADERARLERALQGLRPEDVGELADQDEPADQASDLYENELDQGLAERLREALAAVGRAEARLAAGTYGLSIESGRPIPDERLEAIPTAERTAEEQDRYDRGRR
jgi:DnaK suppressor protein